MATEGLPHGARGIAERPVTSRESRTARRLLAREFAPWLTVKLSEQRVLIQALTERQAQMEATWAAARPLLDAVCREDVPGGSVPEQRHPAGSEPAGCAKGIDHDGRNTHGPASTTLSGL